MLEGRHQTPLVSLRVLMASMPAPARTDFLPRVRVVSLVSFWYMLARLMRDVPSAVSRMSQPRISIVAMFAQFANMELMSVAAVVSQFLMSKVVVSAPALSNIWEKFRTVCVFQPVMPARLARASQL